MSCLLYVLVGLTLCAGYCGIGSNTESSVKIHEVSVTPSRKLGDPFVFRPKLSNLFGIQLGFGVSCSSAGTVSPFLYTVPGVIKCCSRGEMLGVNAGWIIAGVKNEKMRWKISIREPKGKSVSLYGSSVDMEYAISVFIHPAYPFPASRGFLNNSTPEGIKDLFRGEFLVSGNRHRYHGNTQARKVQI